MRGVLLVLFSLALLLVRALPAAGHAAPVIMDPPGGAVLGAVPKAVRLQFSQPVELQFSQVEVSSGGQTIGDRSALRLDGARRLIYPLPPLAPGRYDVKWRVLSTDGHVTEGSYWFRVAEGAKETTASGGPEGAEPTGAGGWLLHPLVMLPIAPLLFFVVRGALKRRRILW
ncbi:MAG: copper resistance CopC family protein [Bacillota bacterium]